MAEFNQIPNKEIEKSFPKIETSQSDSKPINIVSKPVQAQTEDTLEADKKAFEDLSKAMPIDKIEAIQIAFESEKNFKVEDWFNKKNLEKK